MRTALLLSGQARCVEHCHPSLQEHIIGPLGCDTFFHFWEDIDRKPELTIAESVEDRCMTSLLSRDAPTQEKLLSLYRPVLWKIEPQISFEGQRVPARVISMFYSNKIVNDAKRSYEAGHGFRYDLVIRCRTDLEFKHGLLEPCVSNLEQIHCYQFGHSLGRERGIFCNDQFAFGRSSVMDAYAGCYDYL